jgi:hypothetical protein
MEAELIEEGPGQLVRSRITGPGERTTKSYVPRRLVNLGPETGRDTPTLEEGDE